MRYNSKMTFLFIFRNFWVLCFRFDNRQDNIKDILDHSYTNKYDIFSLVKPDCDKIYRRHLFFVCFDRQGKFVAHSRVSPRVLYAGPTCHFLLPLVSLSFPSDELGSATHLRTQSALGIEKAPIWHRRATILIKREVAKEGGERAAPRSGKQWARAI